MTSASRADLTRQDAFPHWTTEKIRFQDIDRLDHVNNVKYAVYAESARLELLQWLAPESLAHRQQVWVIAQLTLDFRAPAYYPGEIHVGTRLLRLGKASVTLGQGMFAGERCVATADSVLVLMDTVSQRSVPLSDELRVLLGAAAPGQ